MGEHIQVNLATREVALDAIVCLQEGWLEQIACSPGSREHESLVVVAAKASKIHAALLMAGFEPGEPGSFSYENEQLKFHPPQGDRVEVSVRYTDQSGQIVENPISRWVHDAVTEEPFPENDWVFAGSAIVENAEWMGPGEHYVADVTGSIIGLATFGGEVLAYPRALSPDAIDPTAATDTGGSPETELEDADSRHPAWAVDPDHIPPLDTPVEILLRPVRE